MIRTFKSAGPLAAASPKTRVSSNRVLPEPVDPAMSAWLFWPAEAHAHGLVAGDADRRLEFRGGDAQLRTSSSAS